MDIFSRQFGLVIAYLIPGFIALIGLAPFAPVVASWFDADHAAGISAPIYAVLAATAIGMIISAFRWLIIDTIHNFTLGKPAFNAKALEDRAKAFQYLVEGHYRFYQNYSHTLLAIIWTYSIYRWLEHSPRLSIISDLCMLALCIVLFIASHDALAKYRRRIRQLTGDKLPVLTGDEFMTNGIDHSHGGSSPKAKATPKPIEVPKDKPKPEQAKPAAK